MFRRIGQLFARRPTADSADISLPTIVTPIQRQRTIEGTAMAGIIRNIQNHFCDVEIFADGMVNAWELNDLTQFAARFEGGPLRVLTSIPDGEDLSIFHLGNYRVTKARWKHTPQSYLRRVEETVRALNPEMSNLYCVTPLETEQNDRRRVKYGSHAKPFRVTGEIGYFKEEGSKTRLFVRHDGRYLLADLCVFKSGNVRLCHPELIEETTLDELDAGFREGRFVTSIDAPQEVSCGELGALTLVNGGYCVDLAAKREELHAMFEALNDKDRRETCRQAYYQYLEYPSDFTRDQLRKAYENVPEHQRIYLGDMDTRDTDYRRILYSSEKREV